MQGLPSLVIPSGCNVTLPIDMNIANRIDTMPKLLSTITAHRNSSLRNGRRFPDPARLIVFCIVAVAALAFVASMVAVLFMHAP